MLKLVVLAIPFVLSYAGDFPTMEEAVTTFIQGDVKLSRKGTVIQHDFQFPDHNKDFQGALRTVVSGNPSPNFGEKDGKMFVAGGTMGFGLSSPVQCLVPLESFDQISLGFTGVTSLALTLEGPDDTVDIELGAKSRLRSRRGDEAGRWQLGRGRELDLAGTRIDVSWKKGTLTVAAGGKPIFKEKFDKDATGYQRFGFECKTGKEPALQSCLIKGELHPALPLMVANLHGFSQTQLPRWEHTYEASSTYTKVLCPTSQKDAERFAKGADAAMDRFFAVFNSPPGWKRTTKAYIFQYPEVLRAYCEVDLPRALDGGVVAMAMHKPEEDLGVLAGLVLADNLNVLSRSVPEWWELGLTGYQRGLHLEGDALVMSELPAEVKQGASESLSKLGEKFGEYLGEKAIAQDAASLARAWIHFLLEGGDESHRELLVKFYQSLLKGNPGEKAAAETFPPATLESLRAAFAAYLAK